MKLRWEWVDLQKRFITLPGSITKNDKPRKVPLGVPQLFETLRMQKSKHDALWPQQELVFVRADGSPLGDIRRAFLNACFAAGFWKGNDRRDQRPTKMIHDLRRSYAHHLRDSGIPLNIAQLLTGHLTRDIYLDYSGEHDIKDEQFLTPLSSLASTCTRSDKAPDPF